MTQASRRRPAFEGYTASQNLYDPTFGRSRTYSPSWLEGQKTRIETMTETEDKTMGLLLKGKTQLDCDSGKPHGHLYLTLPPWLSLDNGDVIFQHDLLEQEYQYLRKGLIGQREIIQTQENKKEMKKKKKKVKIAETPRLYPNNRLDMECNVSVSEYLQTTDTGMDHFQKHLQCVKKLARKYKKHRKISAHRDDGN